MISKSDIDYILNPFNFNYINYFIFYIIKFLALMLLDKIIESVITYKKPNKLPYRINYPNQIGLKKLEFVDYTFLFINSFIEYIFVLHIIQLIFFSSSNNNNIIINNLQELSWKSILIKQPIGLIGLFVLDDFMYSICHRILHFDLVYAYIHKHHHRQSLPIRGYWDAGNEHPIEQIMGQGLLYLSIILVSKVIILHWCTVFIYFIIYAILALLNHTEYDIKINFLLFEYTVRAHSMHHRYPKCNMAQYFMGWDRIMGTYQDYKADIIKKKKKINNFVFFYII